MRLKNWPRREDGSLKTIAEMLETEHQILFGQNLLTRIGMLGDYTNENSKISNQ